MRSILRGFFEAEPDFELCGEAEHGREAIDKAIIFKPHLIILDFQMPVMNGLEAAPILLTHLPTVIIILHTAYATDALESAALASGVHAVVPKESAGMHLIPTARALFKARQAFGDGRTATA